MPEKPIPLTAPLTAPLTPQLESEEKHVLIPEPTNITDVKRGQLTCLREAMCLDVLIDNHTPDRERIWFDGFTNIARIGCKTFLDNSKSWRMQDGPAWDRFLAFVIGKEPLLQRFHHAWPAEVYVYKYLGSRARDVRRSKAALAQTDATDEPPGPGPTSNKRRVLMDHIEIPIRKVRHEPPRLSPTLYESLIEKSRAPNFQVHKSEPVVATASSDEPALTSQAKKPTAAPTIVAGPEAEANQGPEPFVNLLQRLGVEIFEKPTDFERMLKWTVPNRVYFLQMFLAAKQITLAQFCELLAMLERHSV